MAEIISGGISAVLWYWFVRPGLIGLGVILVIAIIVAIYRSRKEKKQ